MTRLFHKPWTLAQIDEIKAGVRSELEHALADGGVAARLEAILAGLRAHEAAEDSPGQLRLYVYVVSALVHQERYGGLGRPQINRFVNLAYAVLKYQQIQPETSKLGFLYGELHLALSQIHRREGEHWSASWEQQLAAHLSRRGTNASEALQSLGVAIRALRLGQGARALAAFQDAETAAKPAGSTFEKARIGRIRALRLSGRHGEAQALADQTLGLSGLTAPFVAEVGWELLCLAAGAGDLGPMMTSVQRGGPHHAAVYLAEAFLWAHGVRELSHVGRLPKMQTLARKKDLRPGELGFFLKAALQIESCYDQEVPYTLRLKALGPVLAGMSALVSIDRELLVQLAATRWLARQHATTLAATTLGEYQGMSLKLSLGSTGDVLGVAGDLLEKAWAAGGSDGSELEEVKEEKNS